METIVVIWYIFSSIICAWYVSRKQYGLSVIYFLESLFMLAFFMKL